MTNTNNTRTRNNVSRPAALAYVIEHFGDQIKADSADTFKALTDWADALGKKRTNTEPTKEQKANAALLENVIQAIATVGEPVTARWVVNNVNGILTIQKASALLRKGVQSGRIVADVTKKVTEYTVA